MCPYISFCFIVLLFVMWFCFMRYYATIFCVLLLKEYNILSIYQLIKILRYKEDRKYIIVTWIIQLTIPHRNYTQWIFWLLYYVMYMLCQGVCEFYIILSCYIIFILFGFILFCFVLFCFVLFWFVLVWFVFFCIVLYCFILFCFVLFFCFYLFFYTIRWVLFYFI